MGQPSRFQLILPLRLSRRPLLLDELDERAERRLRVHEGHRRAAGARAWRLVDHPAAGVLHRLQRHGAVVDPVADVVEALALVGQVLRHRGVVADRVSSWT